MTDLPDDEALLARFRQWLRDARAGADEGAGVDLDAGEEGDVGLYRLAEEFTALRHEVKLQTRSARGVQEQAEALLPALGQAIEQFRAVGPKEEQAAFAAARPLAEALADLDEALDRGRAGAEKARGRFDEQAEALAASLETLRAGQPWYRRLWLRPYHDEARALVARQARGAGRDLVNALVEGYALIQSRLRRAMDAEQVRRIDVPGRPVDPERMTVVEVVDAPGTPPGHVVDEVRRGYTWRGRLLRFAEVRAARLPPQGPDDGDENEVDEDEDEDGNEVEVNEDDRNGHDEAPPPHGDPTHGHDHRH